MNKSNYGEMPPAVSVKREMCQPVYTIRVGICAAAEGGFECEEATLDRGVWNRSAIISAIVRMRYTADDVEAIVNNVFANIFDADRQREYRALQEWRAKAKSLSVELMAYATEHNLVDWDVPDEETYRPTDVELTPDGVETLMQAVHLLKGQVLELDDEQAAEVPALFPTWESMIGDCVDVGKRLFYGGRLWKVIQAHKCQAEWTPDVATSLFTEVVAHGDVEIGTLENPIPYNGNMELEEGKYYSQDGVTYLCTRSTGVPVYNALRDLIGLYVQVV